MARIRPNNRSFVRNDASRRYLTAVNGFWAWIACGPHTKEGISKESMAARTGGGTDLVLLVSKL